MKVLPLKKRDKLLVISEIDIYTCVKLFVENSIGGMNDQC